MKLYIVEMTTERQTRCKRGQQYLNLSGREVIKLSSYSAQLSMNFILLINVKMPTIVHELHSVSKHLFVSIPTSRISVKENDDISKLATL